MEYWVAMCELEGERKPHSPEEASVDSLSALVQALGKAGFAAEIRSMKSGDLVVRGIGGSLAQLSLSGWWTDPETYLSKAEFLTFIPVEGRGPRALTPAGVHGQTVDCGEDEVEVQLGFTSKDGSPGVLVNLEEVLLHLAAVGVYGASTPARMQA